MTAPRIAPAGGVYSPVLTPFEADGTPSLQRLRLHCRWLLAQGVGLALFGTNSESASLALAEKRALFDGLCEAGLPVQRMMPGTGGCALPEVIELTRHVVAAGCSRVLMLPPFYYKGVSDEGLFRGFAEVIEAVGDARLRLYLYHIPPVAHVGISFRLIERLLRRYPGVVAGIKDSSGEWANTEGLLREFQPQGFDVFAGNETSLLQTMRGGGAGCITATGNVNPAPIVRLYREWDHADAERQQWRLNETRSAFAQLPLIAAMKAAIAWKSGDGGWAAVRPPLVALDAVQLAQLCERLDAVGFDIADAAALSARAPLETT